MFSVAAAADAAADHSDGESLSLSNYMHSLMWPASERLMNSSACGFARSLTHSLTLSCQSRDRVHCDSHCDRLVLAIVRKEKLDWFSVCTEGFWHCCWQLAISTPETCSPHFYSPTQIDFTISPSLLPSLPRHTWSNIT